MRAQRMGGLRSGSFLFIFLWEPFPRPPISSLTL